jgi:hypothetical protein
MKLELFLNDMGFINEYNKKQINFILYFRNNKNKFINKIDKNMEKETKSPKLVLDLNQPLSLNIKTISKKQKKIISIKNKISEDI